MHNLIKYIKNSYVLITINLNPFRWFDEIHGPFYIKYDTSREMDPGLIIELIVKVLFFKLIIFIDDGRW